jgi:hypothetical protein
MAVLCDPAAQFYWTNENSESLSRRRTIPALFLMLPVFCMIAAAPGLACRSNYRTSLAAVDDALSKHTLSSPSRDKATELRANLAELLAQGKRRDAAAVEAQIMDIMGLKWEGGKTRGCSGHWVAKGE